MINPNSKLNPLLMSHKINIVKACRNHFDHLCKLIIIFSNENKKLPSFFLQNFEIFNPIGYLRMILIESLEFIVKLTTTEKNCIINDLSATIWHILLINFLSNRINDIFQSKFLTLLEIAFTYGSEETLINILFKVNLIGSLYNAFETFVRNEVADRNSYIDCFIFYLKKIANLIQGINKVN